MKHLLTALAIAVPVAIVGIPTSANADTPGCVTRAEYRAVSKGMTISKVASIFDTSGTRQAISTTSGGYASQVRSYKTCAAYSAVSIAYSRSGWGKPWKLSVKSAVWSG